MTTSCPFPRKAHKVQAQIEINGVNFLLFERLRALNYSSSLAFEHVALRCVQDTLRFVPEDDVWISLKPGVISSVLFNFTQFPDASCVSDAMWAMRVFVAVRCEPAEARDVVGALKAYCQSGVAFSSLIVLYQQRFCRLVPNTTVQLVAVNAPRTNVGVPPNVEPREETTNVPVHDWRSSSESLTPFYAPPLQIEYDDEPPSVYVTSSSHLDYSPASPPEARKDRRGLSFRISDLSS